MEDIQQLNEKVSSLEKRLSVLEAKLGNSSSESSVTNNKKLSIKEFIISKGPSGNVEKTLAIACYFEKYEGFGSINIEDLARGFQLAKEAIPTNINDKVNMNIKKGHMAEVKEKKDNKKAWIVTNSGEKFLDNGFKEIKKETTW
ncbi:MAG: hypothetical protein AAB518_01010 [Patescibacteria group bacterium]